MTMNDRNVISISTKASVRTNPNTHGAASLIWRFESYSGRSRTGDAHVCVGAGGPPLPRSAAPRRVCQRRDRLWRRRRCPAFPIVNKRDRAVGIVIDRERVPRTAVSPTPERSRSVRAAVTAGASA